MNIISTITPRLISVSASRREAPQPKNACCGLPHAIRRKTAPTCKSSIRYWPMPQASFSKKQRKCVWHTDSSGQWHKSLLDTSAVCVPPLADRSACATTITCCVEKSRCSPICRKRLLPYCNVTAYLHPLSSTATSGSMNGRVSYFAFRYAISCIMQCAVVH